MKHRCPVCGSDVRGADKRRSVPQLRRYFALVKAAFTHWPDAHDFRPDNAEHLRRWLQCKAGHHEATRIEIPSGDPAVMRLARLAAEAAIDAADGSAFVKPFGDVLVVFKAKSIAFDKLTPAGACQLFDEVGAVIEAEIGIPAERLLRETEAAA